MINCIARHNFELRNYSFSNENGGPGNLLALPLYKRENVGTWSSHDFWHDSFFSSPSVKFKDDLDFHFSDIEACMREKDAFSKNKSQKSQTVSQKSPGKPRVFSVGFLPWIMKMLF